MSDSNKMSVFATTIMNQKYAKDTEDGKESWPDIAKRVAWNVMKAVNAPKSVVKEIEKMIADRKFMPGGRYLYAAGMPIKQCQNCALFRAEDSREGWADLMQKITLALMTGAGVGVVYSDVRGEGKAIRKTGGTSTGPLALMQMVNEAGRGIMQGGSRRSAIWAGLHWNHPDIVKFIQMKNWGAEVRAMKAKDYNFPATMDGTNISVILDDAFFKAFHDEKHVNHALAHTVYWTTLRQMLKTAEPGFSVDVGVNKKENLRNAPVVGNTRIRTFEGWRTIESIIDKPTTIWTGKRWAKDVVFTQTSEAASIVTVYFVGDIPGSVQCDEDHPFLVEDGDCWSWGGVRRVPAKDLKKHDRLIVSPPDSCSKSYAHTEVTSIVFENRTQPVYCADVGLSEHSFEAEGVIVSNCTEITSHDDSDICNLGSINMARIESLEEMKRITELATIFLLAGTVYSDVPFAKIDQIRTKNRRLGLGLMGLHEWLLLHGKKYGFDPELEEYLKIYATSTDIAEKYAKEWDLSIPIKTRALAPTGTISIVAETTTGIEPIFCIAYKRRYLKGNVVHYQYVIDPTAHNLIEKGVNPDSIEDAYTLAEDVERRVAFQAWVQKYVDHAISSTINLPEWGSELNNGNRVQEFGNMLMKYLPQLRGMTCYPDGARGGQPLTPVKYTTAIKHLGQEFSELVLEATDVCDITKGGSCGS